MKDPIGFPNAMKFWGCSFIRASMNVHMTNFFSDSMLILCKLVVVRGPISTRFTVMAKANHS